VGWRLHRQLRRTGAAVSTHSASAEERITKAARKAKKAARRANSSGHRLQMQIEGMPVEETVKKAARRANATGQRALRQIESVPVRKAAHQGAQTATHYMSAGAELAEAVLSQARGHLASS
jgi:hypothetical protein